MFSYIKRKEDQFGIIISLREIESLLFANVSRLRSSYPVRSQNFEDNTEGEVTAPAENEEEQDLVLSPPHGGDIELGLRRQEISMDALPSLSNSNGESNQSARTFICLSDGTSVTRYVREANSILNNEMCPETGFGPKQESIRVVGITGITLTRWRLASTVLREYQHSWGQHATPYERISEVEAGCPIYKFRAKDLNTNFLDPQVKNWPGNDLLGREDTLLRSLLLSFATAAYGGVHASA